MKKFMSVMLAFVMLFSSALTPLSVVYAQEDSPLTVSEVSDEAAGESSASAPDPAAEDAAAATADAGTSGEGGSAASADAGGAGSAGEGDPAAPTDAGAGLAGTESSAGVAAAAGDAAAPDANGMLLQGNMLSSANAVSAGAAAAPAANETITDSFPTVIGLNASGSEPAVASGDVPVTPNINVVPAASGETHTYVAGVSTTGESTATVGGDVIVSPTINSNAEGNAEVIGIDAAGGGTVAVTGDVSVTSNTTVNSSVENYTQETNGINFNAGTNVSADDVIVNVKTEGASSTGAAGIDSDYSYGDGDQAVVEVKKDVSVTVTAKDGDADAAGIENHNANMDMKVKGDVSVEVSAAEGSAGAEGVSEGIWWGESTKADLYIAGDVSVTAAGKDASSEGIYVYDSSDVPVAVWADDVTSKATAEDGSASATGVSNYATGNGDTNVNVASVEVVAEGNAEDEKYFYQTWVPDGGNVYGDETDTGKATTTVRGDVTVEAKSDTLYAGATGVSASSVGNVVYEKSDDEEPSEPGEGHYEDREGTRAVHAEGVSSYGINTDVTIEGNVNVTADSDRSYATGLSANSSNDGITIVDVIGNITVATSDSDQYKDDTNAIYAMIHGSGKVDVTVGDEEKLDDNGIITEGGDVTSDGNGIRVETQQDASGTAEIEVLGDVTAGVYGLELDMRGEDSVADIIVNGTLSGEESGIVISDNTTADNVQLTVWKVDLTEVEGEEEKHAVTKEGGRTVDPETKEVKHVQTVTEETKKIEENIRYIIKIEQNENATLGVEGTTKVDGYDTAKEGDSVIFKVAAKEGYTVTGAYNGLGEKVPLVKNANGDYYVVVERGGGVYLSVTVEGGSAEPEPEPEPTEEPGGNDNGEQPGTDYQQPVGNYLPALQIYYGSANLTNGSRWYCSPSNKLSCSFNITTYSNTVYLSVDGGPEITYPVVNGNVRITRSEDPGIHTFRVRTSDGTILTFEMAFVKPIDETTVYGKEGGTSIYGWPGQIRNGVIKQFNEAITITGEMGDYYYVAGKDISGGAFVLKDDVNPARVEEKQPNEEKKSVEKEKSEVTADKPISFSEAAKTKGNEVYDLYQDIYKLNTDSSYYHALSKIIIEDQSTPVKIFGIEIPNLEVLIDSAYSVLDRTDWKELRKQEKKKIISDYLHEPNTDYLYYYNLFENDKRATILETFEKSFIENDNNGSILDIINALYKMKLEFDAIDNATDAEKIAFSTMASDFIANCEKLDFLAETLGGEYAEICNEIKEKMIDVQLDNFSKIIEENKQEREKKEKEFWGDIGKTFTLEIAKQVALGAEVYTEAIHNAMKEGMTELSVGMNRQHIIATAINNLHITDFLEAGEIIGLMKLGYDFGRILTPEAVDKIEAKHEMISIVPIEQELRAEINEALKNKNEDDLYVYTRLYLNARNIGLESAVKYCESMDDWDARGLIIDEIHKTDNLSDKLEYLYEGAEVNHRVLRDHYFWGGGGHSF